MKRTTALIISMLLFAGAGFLLFAGTMIVMLRGAPYGFAKVFCAIGTVCGVFAMLCGVYLLNMK